MHLISIIIPVYNSEKYLIECLDSVLLQTYKNFEALLINDGSTDNSGEICDNFAVKDSRFKVFHKKNGGVSSARNFGIKEAKGEWICFVDSDDFVSDLFLANIFNNDLYFIDFIFTNDYFYNSKLNSIKYKSMKNKKFSTNLFFKEYGIILLDTPWAKFYNAKIVHNNNVQFSHSYAYREDTIFNLDYIKYCANILTINNCYYSYRDSFLGLSKVFNSFEKELDLYEVILKKITEITELFGYFESRLNVSRLLSLTYVSTYSQRERLRRVKLIKEKFPNNYTNIFTGDSIISEILKFLLKNNLYLFDIFYRWILKQKYK